MKILIDLNIILDYLEDRAPFADEAENVIEDKRNQLFVSAHMVTTAFYLMRGKMPPSTSSSTTSPSFPATSRP